MKAPRLAGTIPCVLLAFAALTSGCKKDISDPLAATATNADIPPDPEGSAPATALNNIVPSGVFSRTAGSECRIKINMLGITNPSNGRFIELAANQSVFVTEDGVLQGLKVTNVSAGNALSADVVFTVDNSGSMSEEADSIAGKIISFVYKLRTSGIDLRVGCAGYRYGVINGARNLTDAATLISYLSRTTGTSRTVGFEGPDAETLNGTARTIGGGIFPLNEDGILAIWFADSMFAWRPGAQRVFVNFTDEAIQPNAIKYWSVDGLRERWAPSKGSIHTVYSLDNNYWSGVLPDTLSARGNGGAPWQDGLLERPWSLSWFSGGTVKIIHSDAHDLDLSMLPVTGALSASSLVEFLTDDPYALHTVLVTVREPGADGKTIFSNIRY